MRRKEDVEHFSELIDIFNKEIFVFMCENSMTLRELFEYSDKNNPRFNCVLSELWANPSGKAYIQGKMKRCRNKPSPKQLQPKG